MELEAFIKKKGSAIEPLEDLLMTVQNFVDGGVNIKIYDVATKEGKAEASKRDIEEIPSLLFSKVKISGHVNLYFILACVAQLLTSDGNDQVGAQIEISGDDADLKINVASGFLAHQLQGGDDSANYLMLIRPSTDYFNPEKIEEIANNGTTVFLLTNFEEGSKRKEIAKIGAHEKILIGHILRTNIHMTMSLNVRKGRPFMGAFIRAKKTKEGAWKGKWSPRLHDTVSELKDFYIPLFNTSSPVHLDGTIPEPLEVNRLVAKVKDTVEIIRLLFFH